MKKLLGMAFSLMLTVSAYATDLPALNYITDKLKDSVANLDDETLQGMMVQHYQTMRLMDEAGIWAAPELAYISEDLLPSNLTVEDANALIDQMAFHATENPYMVAFFERVEGESFPFLADKLATEQAVLPAVVAYALLQENLTKAMYNDWTLMQVLKDIWVVAREEAGIYDNMDAFAKAKLTTVELPINKYIEFHTTGEVPEYFSQLLLPINILEAMAVDTKNGFLANAATGAVLAANNPGELPARFSDDGKAILITSPKPKEWADLYAVWNMAFVSHFEYFPFVMVKLMIPQVNNINAEPEAYMYNRALALYSHLHFSYIGQADQLKAGVEPMQWHDRTLTEIFGEVNWESAKDYKKQVIKDKLFGF